MASTPPPRSLRVRTPPTPLHGAAYDNYDPYSPRRSTRSTAQSNPYSSSNADRSPKANLRRSTPPPPTSVKKARFARAPAQLTSPPSSPASPQKSRLSSHKTPQKKKQQSFHSRNHTGAQSDSDAPSNSRLGPSNIDPVTMLPTPSKTPNKKRPAAAITSTARILSFQPDHPNDVMPSRKTLKKHARSLTSKSGFELYEDEEKDGSIEIYTDANARVPEMDESEDNPFVGRRKREAPRPQRRRKQKSRLEVEQDARIDEAVRRDEGVTYVFRGKKIFRPFQSPPTAEGEEEEGEASSAAGTDLGGAPEQRRLRRQAGAAAQRPLTRSAIKPRLLFPSSEQDLRADDVDEEASTDIEMGNVGPDTAATPVTVTRFSTDGNSSKPQTPPTTNKASRRQKKKVPPPVADATPTAAAAVGEETEPMSLTTTDASPTSANAGGRGSKGRSPFDSWQRSKVGRKRAGEAMGEEIGNGKRTRSSGVGG